jgi:galactoside O-acetyltransferase
VFIYATNKIKLGNNTHIASFVSITGGGILMTEDFSGIASGSRIITGTDDFKDWGFGGPSIDKKYRNLKTGTIHIGKFCIVGANSVILPDVQIGEGAMVGAGSVVTKDLAPWGVYVGNKRIRERNKDAVLENYAKYLLETQHEHD